MECGEHCHWRLHPPKLETLNQDFNAYSLQITSGFRGQGNQIYASLDKGYKNDIGRPWHGNSPPVLVEFCGSRGFEVWESAVLGVGVW